MQTKYIIVPIIKAMRELNLYERTFVIMSKLAYIPPIITPLEIVGEINVCHRLGLRGTSFLI